MQIDLDEDEARDLKQALDIHLVELRLELTRTDDRAYRAVERATLDRLERVQGRLARLVEGAAATPRRKAG